MAKVFVSANAIRAWFAEHPEHVPDGAKSVGPTARGRLSAEVVEVYLKHNKGKTYAEKSPAESKSVTIPVPDSKGRNRPKTVTFETARALAGDLAGKRGKLSAKALTAAGKAYAAQSAKTVQPAASV